MSIRSSRQLGHVASIYLGSCAPTRGQTCLQQAGRQLVRTTPHCLDQPPVALVLAAAKRSVQKHASSVSGD